MKISLFSGADDNTPKAQVFTWPEFVQEILGNGHTPVTVPADALGFKDLERPFKTSQLMFSPAEFREHGLRRDQDAILVHCGVADLDHLTWDQLAEFLLRMEDMGQEFLLYTGWSHGIGGEVSARVVVPFTRPVAAADWPRFWPRMAHYLGGYCDPQCKNVSRAYFLPSCPAARLEEAQILHRPGRPLDVDQVLGLHVPAEALAASRVTTRVSREEIEAFQKRLAKKNPETGAALAKVLRGEPWAEPGNRDNVLFRLAGDLAKAFPTADPASIAVVFQQSVTHFGGEFTLDAVQDKIQRRQGEVLAEQERRQEEAVRARKLAIRSAFRAGDRDTPYTEEELAAFARFSQCTVEEFKRRWIIQRGGSFYFWVGGGPLDGSAPPGRYVGPYGKDDAKLAAHTFLAPATSVGVRLEELTITGDFVQRSAQDLALEYGTVCDRLVLDMTAQATYYDAPHGTLVEAPCPRRPLEPTYNAEVQRWLQLLAGAEYPNLEMWLAWVTHLDRPCAALFIEGEPGAGKSLLAKGVARIWTTSQPTTLEQAMGGFNSALAECPLVFADETMPKDFRGRGRTGELREFIQSDSRPYKRKYLPDATLRGACRVIIAANNRHLLDGEDSLTPHDVAAIVGRILHIEVGPEAGAFIRACGWTPGTGQEDIIARHVLWLVDNVDRPAHPPRFLVESPASKLHRSITTGTTMGSAVAHWLVSFLLDPKALRMGRPEGDPAHLVRVRGGTLYVNPRALTDYWEVFRTNVPRDKATAKRVMEGIRAMSSTAADARVSLTVPGFTSRPKFYVIRTEDLVEWANNHGHASAEEILEAMMALEDGPASAAG